MMSNDASAQNRERVVTPLEARRLRATLEAAIGAERTMPPPTGRWGALSPQRWLRAASRRFSGWHIEHRVQEQAQVNAILVEAIVTLAEELERLEKAKASDESHQGEMD